MDAAKSHLTGDYRVPHSPGMTKVDRRRFVQLGGLGSAAFGWPGMAQAQSPASGAIAQQSGVSDDRIVRLSGDGLGLNPAQYARLLSRLADESISPDSYSLGGVVDRLEAECARALGKEQAVFMPTGTLANHLAIRALAGGASRVIVQEDSHLYKDEGDCAQTLSGLTLMPLAPGRATFSAADVQQVLDDTKSARVVKRVSVISIETPVRRKGRAIHAAELQRSSAGRRRHQTAPGQARLFPAIIPRKHRRDHSSLRHRLCVALQVFQRGLGPILADRASLADLYHVRRMFGGGLSSV
jgi:threonine aldolase